MLVVGAGLGKGIPFVRNSPLGGRLFLSDGLRSISPFFRRNWASGPGSCGNFGISFGCGVWGIVWGEAYTEE